MYLCYFMCFDCRSSDQRPGLESQRSRRRLFFDRKIFRKLFIFQIDILLKNVIYSCKSYNHPIPGIKKGKSILRKLIEPFLFMKVNKRIFFSSVPWTF